MSNRIHDLFLIMPILRLLVYIPARRPSRRQLPPNRLHAPVAAPRSICRGFVVERAEYTLILAFS